MRDQLPNQTAFSNQPLAFSTFAGLSCIQKLARRSYFAKALLPYYLRIVIARHLCYGIATFHAFSTHNHSSDVLLAR